MHHLGLETKHVNHAYADAPLAGLVRHVETRLGDHAQRVVVVGGVAAVVLPHRAEHRPVVVWVHRPVFDQRQRLGVHHLEQLLAVALVQVDRLGREQRRLP